MDVKKNLWVFGLREPCRFWDGFYNAKGMKQHAVIIEKGPSSYGACVPDLPGCVAVGVTVEEVQRLIGEAIGFHLDGMRADGDPIPEPPTLATYASAQAA